MRELPVRSDPSGRPTAYADTLALGAFIPQKCCRVLTSSLIDVRALGIASNANRESALEHRTRHGICFGCFRVQDKDHPTAPPDSGSIEAPQTSGQLVTLW